MAAYIVKVTIEDTHPPVWRRIAIPEKILYGDLHVILQAAFGWYDAHLHDFSFPGSDFRVVMSEEDMTFGDCALENSRLIDEDITEVKWIRYTYDFGDDWRHKITFEKMDPDYTERYATILKWKGDNFSEDVGGVFGAECFMADGAREECGEEYMEPRRTFDPKDANARLECSTFPVRKVRSGSGKRTLGTEKSQTGLGKRTAAPEKSRAASGSRSSGPSGRILDKETRRVLDELMKAAIESNAPELQKNQEAKTKKPSKNEAMVQKWLDFSDQWVLALKSAGIPGATADGGKQSFKDLQEQFSKEDTWEQMTLPGIDIPKENEEAETGGTAKSDMSVGNCTIRLTTGKHTVEENLKSHSEKSIHDFCRYLRLPAEAGTKADCAAAISGSFREHPEYLRMSCTLEQLESLLSIAGLRDSRYQIMSTDAVEMGIYLGLLECLVSRRQGKWLAELRFACDAKDMLARTDGTDLEDYYSKLEEKDRSVFVILSAYGIISFNELRKLARKFVGIRDIAIDFERYLYWHLRLADRIATFSRYLSTGDVPYAALRGVDTERIVKALMQFEDSLTPKPVISNEKSFKAWKEQNLFSLDAWQKLTLFVGDCLIMDSERPGEDIPDLIEDCYHLVLSGCDVRELCTYICSKVPVYGVSQYVFIWQFVIQVVTETPLPALMGRSRNEFLDQYAEEDGLEADILYEYLPTFPYEGIKGKMKADTHLFDLPEHMAEGLLLTLGFVQASGDLSIFDAFIRDHGCSDELKLLKIMMETAVGDPGKAKKSLDALIKSHKGPVDDLVAFREDFSSIAPSGPKRKKGSKSKADKTRGLFEEFLHDGPGYESDYRSDYKSDYGLDYEADNDPDYGSDYEDAHVVRIPVQRETPKIYPNDPCPCGSGKKYKKCCGKNKT